MFGVYCKYCVSSEIFVDHDDVFRVSRWWGLTIRKQLAIIFLDDLKQKETTLSEQAANPTAQQEPEPTAEPKVDTE